MARKSSKNCASVGPKATFAFALVALLLTAIVSPVSLAEHSSDICSETALGLPHGTISAATRISQLYKDLDPDFPMSPDLLIRVWRKNEIFRDAKFYSAIGTNPKTIQKIYESWYGSPSQKFPLFLAGLPTKYLALSLDPGIVARHTAFLHFASAYLERHPQASLIELREAFSRDQGSRVQYRALALTEDEAKQVQTKGISPQRPTFQNYIPQTYEDTGNPWRPRSRIEAELMRWAALLKFGPKEDMLKRITHLGAESFSQSITEFPEVADYAARLFGRPDETIYIFKLEIPVLEITEAARVTDRMGHQAFESMGKQFFMDQPGVENFVTGTIHPSWITGRRPP